MPNSYGAAVGVKVAQQNIVSSTTLFGTVAASATVNAQGAWTTLASSTPFDVVGFDVILCNGSATAFAGLEIGIGAAGSELTLVPEFCLITNNGTHNVLHIPLSVPAGVRIAARLRSATASVTQQIGLTLHSFGPRFGRRLTRCAVYGFDPTTSKGTALDAGAVANTKGSYVQFAASLAHPVLGVAVAVQTTQLSGMTATQALVDVALGAGNTIVLPDAIGLNGGGSMRSVFAGGGVAYCNQAGAQSLQARHQASSATANTTLRNLLATILCFY